MSHEEPLSMAGEHSTSEGEPDQEPMSMGEPDQESS
jgi:hypothetical protein